MHTEAVTIAPATTAETAAWRAHRYADHLEVTSLANAGRRGKTCLVLRAAGDELDGAARLVLAAMWADVSEETMAGVLADTGLRCSRLTARGVDVRTEPAVTVDADLVRATFTPREARASFTALMPRPAGGTFRQDENVAVRSAQDAAVAYRWAAENRARIAGMDLTSFRREMSAIGVRLG